MLLAVRRWSTNTSSTSRPSGKGWCRLRTSRSSEEGRRLRARTTGARGRRRRRPPAGSAESARRNLDPDQRLAAAAAAALAASIFLPWWRDPDLRHLLRGPQDGDVRWRRRSVSSPARCWSLLLRRAEGRFFHLPLSDGTLIAARRCLDRLPGRFPDARSAHARRSPARHTDYGLRWGILLALASSVVLAAAGSAHAPKAPPRRARGGRRRRGRDGHAPAALAAVAEGR